MGVRGGESRRTLFSLQRKTRNLYVLTYISRLHYLLSDYIYIIKRKYMETFIVF